MPDGEQDPRVIEVPVVGGETIRVEATPSGILLVGRLPLAPAPHARGGVAPRRSDRLRGNSTGRLVPSRCERAVRPASHATHGGLTYDQRCPTGFHPVPPEAVLSLRFP